MSIPPACPLALQLNVLVPRSPSPPPGVGAGTGPGPGPDSAPVAEESPAGRGASPSLRVLAVLRRGDACGEAALLVGAWLTG
jgi:hypothetical protein